MPSLKSTKSTQNQAEARNSGDWIESTMGILYVLDDSVQFADDWDHWRNAFCRLLEIPEEKAREFVEETVAVAQEKFDKPLHNLCETDRIACLIEATDRVFFAGARPSGGTILESWGRDPISQDLPDTIFAHSVSGNTGRLVAGNREREFAWLVDTESKKPVAADSIVYDTTYFSSGGEAHYGMKHYIAQSNWRLDKARRLVRTVLHNLGERRNRWMKAGKGTHVIDIGSGIGYYRKAFDELGFDHYGIDLSLDIITECRERFGFDTWHSDLAHLGHHCQDMKFQMITLWDVIEHLEEPLEAVQLLKGFLAPDGVLVARTPNLMALEAEILGDYYYSFKFDHVRYFSVKSLNDTMARAGLKPVYVETASHLFKGFLGAESLFKAGQSGRGADIIGVYGF